MVGLHIRDIFRFGMAWPMVVVTVHLVFQMALGCTVKRDDEVSENSMEMIKEGGSAYGRDLSRPYETQTSLDRVSTSIF
jgi:hypothetical protein